MPMLGRSGLPACRPARAGANSTHSRLLRWPIRQAVAKNKQTCIIWQARRVAGKGEARQSKARGGAWQGKGRDKARQKQKLKLGGTQMLPGKREEGSDSHSGQCCGCFVRRLKCAYVGTVVKRRLQCLQIPRPGIQVRLRAASLPIPILTSLCKKVRL